MKTGLTQIQQQKLTQEQIQQQSAMQVLAARLTELPVESLRERVQAELDENPYLETRQDLDKAVTDSRAGQDSEYDQRKDYSSEDDIPDYMLHDNRHSAEDRETAGIIAADTPSFYEQLKEQAGGYQLDDHDRKVLEYIIGSLGDDGLLHKPLHEIADELTVYHWCDTTEADVERMLGILWQFEPTGVGARNLQECLILQCRKYRHTQLQEIITHDWDDIKHNRWSHIRDRYHLTAGETDDLRAQMHRLNPRPGNAMSEKDHNVTQTIIPDFTVEVDSDGHISLTLNDTDIPTLQISDDAQDLIDQSFVREYVNKGKLFISAMLQRRQTMLHTMQAIIRIQKNYFTEGDESRLKPMRLEDIARITKLDPSTVSRVCNSKYVDTPYGIHPLKWFFTTAIGSSTGETTTRQVRNALQEIIDNEDKHAPLGDDQIARILNGKGYDVARRTVSKYREQMGIPTSRMRKQ